MPLYYNVYIFYFNQRITLEFQIENSFHSLFSDYDNNVQPLIQYAEINMSSADLTSNRREFLIYFEFKLVILNNSLRIQ